MKGYLGTSFEILNDICDKCKSCKQTISLILFEFVVIIITIESQHNNRIVMNVCHNFDWHYVSRAILYRYKVCIYI